jgi:hypothetical protein
MLSNGLQPRLSRAVQFTNCPQLKAITISHQTNHLANDRRCTAFAKADWDAGSRGVRYSRHGPKVTRLGVKFMATRHISIQINAPPGVIWFDMDWKSDDVAHVNDP